LQELSRILGSGLKPPPERILALARSATGQKAFDAYVLVQVAPVDAFASADQCPIRALRSVPCARRGEPPDWH